jgi:hypothetical protein
VAFSFLGLTIGDDGFGWRMPTLPQWREAIAQKVRDLRGLAYLNSNPGSYWGDHIDLVVTAIDLAGQAATEAVNQSIFGNMIGVRLDQFLADQVTRVDASESEVELLVYGSAGGTALLGTLVRATQTGPAFATDAPATIVAGAVDSYVVEILDFAAGNPAYVGQSWTITCDGVPVSYGPINAFDTGQTVRDGLVANIAGAGVTQTPFRAGRSPTNNRWALAVLEESGGGSFPLAVSGPVGTIQAYNAARVDATAVDDGPVVGNAESLRLGPPYASVQGYVNVRPAVVGHDAETDSQMKARHQITQRGKGGGSPDAIRAIILSPAIQGIGGGGATYAAVEYNPDDVIDAAGNKPHSIRIVVDQAVDGQQVANAGWKAKAAGDNTNGTESYSVVDAVGKTQGPFWIDRLQDLWLAIQMEVAVSEAEGWSNIGDPLAQLRQDVWSYTNNLQANADARVNLLPISTNPDGTPRGVVNFRVRIGVGPQGGPYVFGPWYPTPEPNANAASVPVTSRQKAKAELAAVTASYI